MNKSAKIVFKFFIFLISLTLLFSCSSYKKTAVSKKSYHLVWSDEFDYQGKPDSTKWGYETGFIRNNEKQYYTDSLKNVRVENGVLIIESHKEKIANKDYNSLGFEGKSWLKYISAIDTAQYTSGSITTKGLAEWTYGKIEVKAKLPKGTGHWPAIWMLGTNRNEVGWPSCGEIDIMEHVGYDKDSIYGSVHTKAYNHIARTQKTKGIFIKNPYDEFHIYSLEWTPESITIFLDGQPYLHFKNDHKTADEWPYDQNFDLKLNDAIGGAWGGQKGIDNAYFPQQFIIDYVRVYQIK